MIENIVSSMNDAGITGHSHVKQQNWTPLIKVSSQMIKKLVSPKPLKLLQDTLAGVPQGTECPIWEHEGRRLDSWSGLMPGLGVGTLV